MTLFWIIAALLVLASIASVLLPLWRRQDQADVSQEAINARIFRERLQELDSELAEGRIEAAQHAQLRAELERTLLSDIPTEAGNSSGRQLSAGRVIVSGFALAVPLLAFAYYFYTAYQGPTEDWLHTRLQLRQLVGQAVLNSNDLPEEALRDLPNFTRVLQAQTQREGLGNPNSLYLLGQAFMQLQVVDQAHLALQRAHRLAPRRPDIMLAYAQAELLSNDGRLTPTSEGLLRTVLAFDPNQRGALMLLGFGAFTAGDYQQATESWRQLLTLLDPASGAARMLGESIAQAELRLAGTSSPDTASPPSIDGAAHIAVTVDLAPELRDRLAPQDTLFIFARAAGGPPMPLAAIRQPAQNFPVSVILDDSSAMLPNLRLSDYDAIIVGARISKAGDVLAQPGDLEGLSGSLSLNEGSLSVSLTVDRIIQ